MIGCVVSMKVLSFSFDGDMPMFPNLIDLELGFESYFGWKLLPHFLTRSPNLQVLTLKQVSSFCFACYFFIYYVILLKFKFSIDENLFLLILLFIRIVENL